MNTLVGSDKPLTMTVTCQGCGEHITCNIETTTKGHRIDFGPVRLHHRTTGHKVDGTQHTRRTA